MEMFNLLFESSEVLKQKAIEVEKNNIATLEKSQQEIKELFEEMRRPKKHKVIYVHETYNRY